VRSVVFAAVLSVLVPSVASAATVDVASASSDVSVAFLGESVTFTSTGACSQPCGLTWRNPDVGLSRFGGAIIGYGPSVKYSWSSFPFRSFNGGPRVQVSSGRVSLDLTQPCAGSGGRLVCHSFAVVYVSLLAP
jgi:hypothetical protein